MTLPLPSSFNPELTTDRLQTIAQWLLEELYATEDDLSRDTDNGYTRGCTTFGRQKNRIMGEALSGKYTWLTLSNGGNDVVFNIGGVPCRFSNDDSTNPSKDAVLAINRYQMSFLEVTSQGLPGRFCFVTDRGLGESAEPRVEFLGFTQSGDLATKWVSNAVRVLRLEEEKYLPAPIPVSKPSITPKQQDDHIDTAQIQR